VFSKRVTVGTETEARTVTFTHNTQGHPETVTDPLNRTGRFEYDQAGRVWRQTLADNRVITYSYDASGNLTFLTPPERAAHGFDYTAVNLTSEYNPPDLGLGEPATQTRYTYDTERRTTTIHRPDGQTVDFEYDTAGRLESVTHADDHVTYAYDGAGCVCQGTAIPSSISNLQTTLAFTYDGTLPLSSTWSGTVTGSVGQAYNNDFRVVSQKVNGANEVAFQHDSDGLLTQAGAMTLTPHPQNGYLQSTALGPVTDSWAYSSFGEPETYTASVSGSPVFGVTYTRDKLGRITGKTETVPGVSHTFTYGYDLAGHLEWVQTDGVETARYTYDGNGNRLTYTGVLGNAGGTYDDQDRLLEYGGATFTYTSNGELATKAESGQTTTYDYDAFGNLRTVALPDGTQIDYVIDDQNRRVGKKVNGVLVQVFLYQDQLEPVAELDGAGNLVSRFVYASRANTPDYMVKDGVTYRIISDHLGSPRLVIDTVTGQIAQQLNYAEFGNLLLDTNPGFQPFGLAGGIMTHTSLTRFGARDYRTV
jgi:YD repeat-containing protein